VTLYAVGTVQEEIGSRRPRPNQVTARGQKAQKRRD
jgi:hypothetical protein